MSWELSATYSAADNKLRLYPLHRFDDETLQRVKAAGYRWAPKQELFVCPAWNPGAEDLALELCGEIDDEDVSPQERAAQRSERFEGYSENRARDGQAAEAAVSAITSGIPLGQPIVVGHHSEKRARRDQKKIERGMDRAVTMWRRSEYWESRARSVIAAADYRDRADVRARRIKKLEADRRREVARFTPNKKAGTVDQVPWYCPVCLSTTGEGVYRCEEHPEAKQEVPHVYCGQARGGSWVQVSSLERIEAAAQRWIDHIDRRLSYERAILEAQGATELLEKPKRPKAPPLLNYRDPEGDFLSENKYHRGEFISYGPQVECTKAQLRRIHADYKGTRLSPDKSHRFRIAKASKVARLTGTETEKTGQWSYVSVFLTDSKVHAKPEPLEAPEPALPDPPKPLIDEFGFGQKSQLAAVLEQASRVKRSEELAAAGPVQVVTVPQLFQTPRELAAEAAELAEIGPGCRVLEPSAGLGRLAAAALEAGAGWVLCVEQNVGACGHLERGGYIVKSGDFLSMIPGFDPLDDSKHIAPQFDVVLMNPPFKDADDIRHINHALRFLRPGGRLVSFCANGPRQQQSLKPWASVWRELPAGSFRESGTDVNAALLLIEKGEV